MFFQSLISESLSTHCVKRVIRTQASLRGHQDGVWWCLFSHSLWSSKLSSSLEARREQSLESNQIWFKLRPAIILDQFLASLIHSFFWEIRIIPTLLTFLDHFPHASHHTHMGYKASTVIIHSLQITTLRFGEVKKMHSQTHVVVKYWGLLLVLSFP